MKKPRTSAKPRLSGVRRAYRGASIFLSETGAFRLSIAIFGHPNRVIYWIGKLTEELETKSVHLTQCRIPETGNPRLLDKITAHLREIPTLPGHTRAVVVTGISRHLPDAAAEHRTGDPAPPFLAEANLDRELFPIRCPHPLLLCVTPTAYNRFRRHAPDLMHWCSHTFDFSETALPDGSHPIRTIEDLQQDRPGTVYANRDEMERAAGIFRSGLDAAIAAHGAEHSETIDVRANLANVLHQLGRTPEALALAQENLQIVRKISGMPETEIATRTSQLAHFLTEMGQYAEAEPLLRDTLRIDRAAFGEDHPRVALRLNNLATLLQATNRLAEAEPLYRDALRIDRAAFGDDNPTVAIRLNNLAGLFQDTTRLAEAEPLMREALRIDRTAFEEDHPNVAIRLNNLATLLQATNRLTEAEPLMREALHIDRTAFGEDHPNVAIRLNNLATLLRATNRLVEAEPLFREAVQIFHDSLGPEHPKTVTASRNLEILLAELGGLNHGAISSKALRKL